MKVLARRIERKLNLGESTHCAVYEARRERHPWEGSRKI